MTDNAIAMGSRVRIVDDSLIPGFVSKGDVVLVDSIVNRPSGTVMYWVWVPGTDERLLVMGRDIEPVTEGDQ